MKLKSRLIQRDQHVEIVLERPQKNLGVDRIAKLVICDDDGEEIEEIPYDESREFFEGMDICQEMAAELDIPRSYIEIRA